MHKLLWLASSILLSLGLASTAAPGPRDEPPPPKKKGDPKKGEPAKKKGEPGAEGDLRRTYDLLRRIKADGVPEGRREDKLRDWTDRAASLYRKGLRALEADEGREAHEFGAAAHDLARAVDHARNASRFDRPDPDLPPPPDGTGPEGDGEMARRELRRAHDRLREIDDSPEGEAKFYLDAARDLYNAARRDAEGDRVERAVELARAAEAMTHVPEHLAHLDEDGPGPKAKGKRERPEPPKEKRERPEPGKDLPPPIN